MSNSKLPAEISKSGLGNCSQHWLSSPSLFFHFNVMRSNEIMSGDWLRLRCMRLWNKFISKLFYLHAFLVLLSVQFEATSWRDGSCCCCCGCHFFSPLLFLCVFALWLRRSSQKNLYTSRGFQRHPQNYFGFRTGAEAFHMGLRLLPSVIGKDDLGPFLQGENSWRKARAACFVLKHSTVLSVTPRWSILGWTTLLLSRRPDVGQVTNQWEILQDHQKKPSEHLCYFFLTLKSTNTGANLFSHSGMAAQPVLSLTNTCEGDPWIPLWETLGLKYISWKYQTPLIYFKWLNRG